MTDTAEKPHEFGLLIARVRDVCNEIRIHVEIVKRDNDGRGNGDSVVGVSDRDTGHWDYRCPVRHRGRMYENLCMEGQVYSSSSDGNILIAYEPRYRSVFALELAEAERIVKTLKAFAKMQAQHRKSMEAAGHGQNMSPTAMMALLAKFVDAKFVVFKDYVDRSAGGWEFLSLSQGLNIYRQQIDKLCADYVDPWKKSVA